MIRAALSRVMSLFRKPDTTAEDAERAVMLAEWMDSANRRQALLDERAGFGEDE
jgi:hypothetical protein